MKWNVREGHAGGPAVSPESQAQEGAFSPADSLHLLRNNLEQEYIFYLLYNRRSMKGIL